MSRTRESTIRLGIEGDDEAKRRLRETGEVGDNALNKVASATRPASRGLKAVDGASREAGDAMRGFANQAGPAGNVLTGLGKGGLLAAAGIGAIAVGLTKAGGIAREAVADFDAIAKTADSIGIGTSALQEYRFALNSIAGLAENQTDAALRAFTTRIGQAAQGTGEAKTTLEAYGIALRDTDGRLRTTDALMGDVALTLKDIESKQEQAAFGARLFGEEAGAKLARALRDGGAAMAAARQEGRELVVVEEDLIRSSEVMQDRFDAASKVIDNNLKRAFVGLFPVQIEAKELWADLTGAAAAYIEALHGVETMTVRAAKGEIGNLDSRIAKLKSMLEKGARPSLKDGVSMPLGGAERQKLIDEMTGLRIERSRFENRIAELNKPLPPLPTLPGQPPLPTLPFGSSASTSAHADLDGAKRHATEAAARASAAEAARRILRSGEDRLLVEEAVSRIMGGQLEAAKEALQLEQDRVAGRRAYQDALRQAQEQGLGPEAAVEQAKLAEQALESQQALARSKREMASAERQLAEQRTKDAAARAEDDRRHLENTEKQTRAAEQLAEIEARNADAARLSMPVIAAGRRVGDVTSLGELQRLLDQIQVEQDAARIMNAGNSAARGAGKFDDVEALRAAAENAERRVIAERNVNELIGRWAEVLRDEAQMRAANERAAEASRQRMAQDISGITRGVFQQAQAWHSVGDAVLGVVQMLERAGAIEGLFGGLFGVKGAGGGGGLGSIFAGFGSDIAQSLGGSGLAPTSTPIPIGPPRMLGGLTQAGVTYPVNELGKGELFRSDVSGRIYPLGGSERTTAMPDVNFRIVTRDPDTRVERIKPSRQRQALQAGQAVGGAQRYR